MRPVRTSIAALVLALLVALPALAIDTSPGAIPPHDPAVRHGTLPNGMKYYVMRNAKPEKRIELRLAVKVGSVQETEEERGLAHFNEHMNFNGSKNFKSGELISWLESIGTRFGADSNAYTSYDETVYMLQIPTDKEGAVERGLVAMADWAGAATLEDAEIEKERGVVLDELRGRKGAARRIRDKQDQLLYQNSRYADRTPIGLEHVITGASTDVVRGFYRRWYQPDVMAIIVVGDLDEAAMEKRVQEIFGALPKPATATTIPEYPVPAHEGTLYSVEADKELNASRLQIAWKHEALDTRTVGDYRRDAVRQVAAGLLSQRLGERAQKADPPFLGAGAGVGDRVNTLMTFTVAAAAKDGTLPVAAKALMEEVERARKHGFVEAELERVKTSSLAAAETAYKESKEYRSDQRIGSMVYAFLDDNVLTSDEYDYELAKALMPGIRLDEVNAAFRELTDTRSRVVLAQAPLKDDAPAPTVDELKAAIEPASGFEVAAYVDDLAGKTLIDFEPSAGTVTSMREIAEIGATEIVLSNGVRVILKPTDYRADQILMNAFAPGGAAAFGEKGYPAAIRADTLADNSGLEGFTATQLGKWLQSQGVIAGASPGVSRLGRSFSGSARPQDLEVMLQLVHLYFTKPAFRDEAFQRMVDSEIEGIRNALNSPGGMYGRAVEEELYGGHWMFRPDTVELVQSLKKDEIEAAYRQMFDDASEWTFFMVGNVDAARHVPLVAKWLGSIPTTSATPKTTGAPAWQELPLRFPEGERKRMVRKGIEDQSRTLFTFAADARLDPQAEFEIDAAADLLEIKLREKLREELGETYGVGVGYSSMFPDKSMGRVVVSWTSAPAPRETMMRVVRETIAHLRQGIPSETDVQKLREMRYNSLAEAEKENGYWLGQMYRSAALGREPKTIFDQRRRIDALTAPKLRAAIRKWLDPKDSVEVYLLPENWSLAEAQVRAESEITGAAGTSEAPEPPAAKEEAAGAQASGH
jgi:zinc protease